MDISQFRVVIPEYQDVDESLINLMLDLVQEHVDVSGYESSGLLSIYLVAHMLKVRELSAAGNSLKTVSSVTEGSVSITYQSALDGSDKGYLGKWLALTHYGRSALTLIEREGNFIGSSERS